MRQTTVRSLLRHDRSLAVGLVLVIGLVTLWLFVPTMQGYVAVQNVDSVDVTATGSRAIADGERVRATFEIHNPTEQPVRITSALIFVREGRTRIDDGTTARFDSVSIEAGETERVTTTIGVRDGREAQVKRAIEADTVTFSGKLRGEIRDARVTIDFDAGEGGR